MLKTDLSRSATSCRQVGGGVLRFKTSDTICGPEAENAGAENMGWDKINEVYIFFNEYDGISLDKIVRRHFTLMEGLNAPPQNFFLFCGLEMHTYILVHFPAILMNIH